MGAACSVSQDEVINAGDAAPKKRVPETSAAFTCEVAPSGDETVLDVPVCGLAKSSSMLQRDKDGKAGLLLVLQSSKEFAFLAEHYKVIYEMGVKIEDTLLENLLEEACVALEGKEGFLRVGHWSMNDPLWIGQTRVHEIMKVLQEKDRDKLQLNLRVLYHTKMYDYLGDKNLFWQKYNLHIQTGKQAAAGICAFCSGMPYLGGVFGSLGKLIGMLHYGECQCVMMVNDCKALGILLVRVNQTQGVSICSESRLGEVIEHALAFLEKRGDKSSLGKIWSNLQDNEEIKALREAIATELNFLIGQVMVDIRDTIYEVKDDVKEALDWLKSIILKCDRQHEYHLAAVIKARERHDEIIQLLTAKNAKDVEDREADRKEDDEHRKYMIRAMGDVKDGMSSQLEKMDELSAAVNKRDQNVEAHHPKQIKETKLLTPESVENVNSDPITEVQSSEAGNRQGEDGERLSEDAAVDRKYARENSLQRCKEAEAQSIAATHAANAAAAAAVAATIEREEFDQQRAADAAAVDAAAAAASAAAKDEALKCHKEWQRSEEAAIAAATAAVTAIEDHQRAADAAAVEAAAASTAAAAAIEDQQRAANAAAVEAAAASAATEIEVQKCREEWQSSEEAASAAENVAEQAPDGESVPEDDVVDRQESPQYARDNSLQRCKQAEAKATAATHAADAATAAAAAIELEEVGQQRAADAAAVEAVAASTAAEIESQKCREEWQRLEEAAIAAATAATAAIEHQQRETDAAAVEAAAASAAAAAAIEDKQRATNAAAVEAAAASAAAEIEAQKCREEWQRSEEAAIAAEDAAEEAAAQGRRVVLKAEAEDEQVRGKKVLDTRSEEAAIAAENATEAAAAQRRCAVLKAEEKQRHNQDVKAKQKLLEVELFMAVTDGNIDDVIRLLKLGVNTEKRYGQLKLTPLHIAAMNMEDIDGEHDGVVRLLISKGANINSLSHNNSTPLHDAAYFGRVGSVEFLLEAGASVNARNDKHQTPRDLAKKKKSPAHYRILDMLDEHAAKTNVGAANLRVGDSQIDFTKFIELSNHGLVVIDFYAAWCPHCVDFEEYWSRLASLHPEVTFCRLICAGTSPDLRTEAHAVASQYGIRRYPTFWLVQNEERLAEFSGAGEQGYRRLNEMIESAVEGNRRTDFFRALQAGGMKMGRGGPLMF